MNKIGTFTTVASIVSFLLAPAAFAGPELNLGKGNWSTANSSASSCISRAGRPRGEAYSANRARSPADAGGKSAAPQSQ